jgi:hypothetical protein
LGGVEEAEKVMKKAGGGGAAALHGSLVASPRLDSRA